MCRGQNLCLVTGLHTALLNIGFKATGSTQAAYPVFGDAGEGAWSHACIGMGDTFRYLCADLFQVLVLMLMIATTTLVKALPHQVLCTRASTQF